MTSQHVVNRVLACFKLLYFLLLKREKKKIAVNAEQRKGSTTIVRMRLESRRASVNQRLFDVKN